MGGLHLILENGMVFEGQSFGSEGDVTGEIVFTTGMTGYLETLTDQSYHGQIVLQTFPSSVTTASFPLILKAALWVRWPIS